jgi:polyisoprenoid-binding protein YceI
MAATSEPIADSELRARLAEGSFAGAWKLDPAQSTVHLRSKSMWGLAPIKGTFGTLSGDGTVSANGEVSGTLTVDSASIDTKNRRRDTHLRSADFFDSATHPHIIFAVQRLTLTSDGATVDGTLRVRDRIRPVTFPVAVSQTGSGALRLEAEVVIDRSNFDVTWNQMGMASMKNVITIRVVFIQH